jgi:hypothetical protein
VWVIACSTYWRFILASPCRFSSWVRVSVSKQLTVLVLAAFRSEPCHHVFHVGEAPVHIGVPTDILLFVNMKNLVKR